MNRIRVAFGNSAIHQRLFDRGRRVQQKHGICNRRAAFPHTTGNRLMRKLKFLDQVMVSLCFFDGVQVGALDVFNQRQFEQLLICGVTDDHRDGIQPCLARGLQTTFAGNQGVNTVFPWQDDQRLDHAVFTDRDGEVLQFSLIKILARLARVTLDRFNGDRRRFRAPEVTEIDATGAGDVFAAAFFTRLLSTRDPWEATRFATLLATCSVTRQGLHGIATAREVDECMTEVLH